MKGFDGTMGPGEHCCVKFTTHTPPDVLINNLITPRLQTVNYLHYDV